MASHVKTDGHLSIPEPFQTDALTNIPEIDEHYTVTSDETQPQELSPTVEETPDEYSDRPVTSFDDLLSKYHLEPITTTEEVSTSPSQENEPVTVEDSQAEEKIGFHPVDNPIEGEASREPGRELNYGELIPDETTEEYEIREEVVNDYGIFEEVKVKRTDHDLETFDRPVVNEPVGPEKTNDKIPEGPEISNEFSGDSEQVFESSHQEQVRADYDAFDRPVDRRVQQEPEILLPADRNVEEESITEIYSGQDKRLESVESHTDADDTDALEFISRESDSGNDQLRESDGKIDEQQKIVSSFDPKRAESIVFAPYHMIDYFASQGIKLTLEENSADPLTKQLKSFTDWLKVMKKLPAQAMAEKPDDKDVDRIRHFAAHSIDEREILTESMAEVLAKQGMYENAIALFQKLSLIYPPKSAYFASRIEQLKASLP